MPESGAEVWNVCGTCNLTSTPFSLKACFLPPSVGLGSVFTQGWVGGCFPCTLALRVVQSSCLQEKCSAWAQSHHWRANTGFPAGMQEGLGPSIMLELTRGPWSFWSHGKGVKARTTTQRCGSEMLVFSWWYFGNFSRSKPWIWGLKSWVPLTV